MPDKFDKKFLREQKAKLLRLKMKLVNNMRLKSNEDMQVSSDELIEDGDQAQTYLNQNVSLGLRERELSHLREIEEALTRIEDGTYGICQETGEPIERKRLEKIPWAKLSIHAAEEGERENHRYIKKAA